MTLRESGDLSGLLNGKSSRPITSLQILEAVHRYPASTSRKLQQSTLLLRIPSSDDLPEILNYLILLLVSTIVGMLLPVVNVNVSDAANQQLQLSLVEHIDEF